MSPQEEQFISAAAYWWSCRQVDPEQQSDARAHLLEQFGNVEADHPLRLAVSAWINFEADQVQFGSRAGDWRRRDRLRDRLIEQLNVALDRVAR